MSMFWRIFKVKSKNSSSSPSTDGCPEGECEHKAEQWEGDLPPNLERNRRHDRMSVSRSGRFKQKSRRRSGLFDNPNLATRKYEIDENSIPSAGVEETAATNTKMVEAEARWRNQGMRNDVPLQAAG